mmetsp:Transcript_9670/g.17002  ORF Transcript_9670/g.17002 Transcript_9670/m.17002 type:complete len:204 (-) Transcript_9670:999-1610(-)
MMTKTTTDPSLQLPLSFPTLSTFCSSPTWLVLESSCTPSGWVVLLLQERLPSMSPTRGGHLFMESPASVDGPRFRTIAKPSIPRISPIQNLVKAPRPQLPCPLVTVIMERNCGASPWMTTAGSSVLQPPRMEDICTRLQTRPTMKCPEGVWHNWMPQREDCSKSTFTMTTCCTTPMQTLSWMKMGIRITLTVPLDLSNLTAPT